MQIDWMEYVSDAMHQEIKHVDFGRLTLLVGPSAAGKSEILKTLSAFFGIVVHEQTVPVPCVFRMGFHVGSTAYRWEISTDGTAAVWENGTPSYAIGREQLDRMKDGKEEMVFRRTASSLVMDGFDRLPTISSLKSVMSVYRDTPPIQQIVEQFAAVSSFQRQENAMKAIPSQLMENIRSILRDAKAKQSDIRPWVLKNSEWPIALDIYIARHAMQKEYQAFLEDVQDIFPEIEEISVAHPMQDASIYVLTIRQDGRDIVQEGISSGMLRTIFILGTLHFRARGSVMLFDELENSLGINCLDEVVDRIQIQAAEAGTQFLLTSHHPYIINQIHVKNWLLVSQSHGVISTKRPEQVGIGTGYRETFYELMNYYQDEERRKA